MILYLCDLFMFDLQKGAKGHLLGLVCTLLQGNRGNVQCCSDSSSEVTTKTVLKIRVILPSNMFKSLFLNTKITNIH